jgi:hypothetical protein
MKSDFSEITSFSAKLHDSFKTAASVYATIGASSNSRANSMTTAASTVPQGNSPQHPAFRVIPDRVHFLEYGSLIL